LAKRKTIKQDILEELQDARLGIYTTQIAKNLNCSRTTVTKYLKMLEEEGLAVVTSVGDIKLWKHKDTIEDENKKESLMNYILPLYTLMLKNFDKIKVDQEKAKKLGKLISKDFKFDKFIDVSLVKSIEDLIKSLKDKNYEKIANALMDIVDSVLKPLDNYDWEEPFIATDKNIIILRMKDSDFITSPMHFYVLSGILEEEINNFFPITISISKIAKKKNMVDIEIDFLK